MNQVEITLINKETAIIISHICKKLKLTLSQFKFIISYLIDKVKCYIHLTLEKMEAYLHLDYFQEEKSKLLKISKKWFIQSLNLSQLFCMSSIWLIETGLITSVECINEGIKLIDTIFGSTETSKSLARFIHMLCDTLFSSSQQPLSVTIANVVASLTTFACLQSVTKSRANSSISYSLITPQVNLLTWIYSFKSELNQFDFFNCLYKRPKQFSEQEYKYFKTIIERYLKYSTAAYGTYFLKFFRNFSSIEFNDKYHSNHNSFSNYLDLDLNDIISSSYSIDHTVDGNTSTKYIDTQDELDPIVHYITIDHKMKSIVLTFRGTLNIQDLLTDLDCDYIDLNYEENKFKVHKGILRSAQLLANQDNNVFKVLKSTLLEYSEYGLVLCGHSLGGAVAAILAILLTKKINNQFEMKKELGLPNRPIHCFTYGIPGVIDLEGSRYFQGLITSIINQQDCIPNCSKGLLQDYAHLNFTFNTEKITINIMKRILKYKVKANIEDEDWFWSIKKTLKAEMQAEKLFPVGSVYLLLGTPTQLIYCDQLDILFGEVWFSPNMLLDHNPASYEESLKKLV